MPRGHNISERDRNCVLDMNAQRTADCQPRFSLREIAIACCLSERAVALIVRQYAGDSRRREHVITHSEDVAARNDP